MAFLPFILLAIAVMLLGAAEGKPLGWVALVLALLATLLELGVGVHVGR